MFEKFLQEIGLSEKEARIYLALLQVDSSSINNIATKTKINRTTVYPVLESLQQKGLVSETQEKKKVAYQAVSPDRLETYLERQKAILQERSSHLKDILPQMKSLQRELGQRPVIKYFEGRESAINSNREFFSTNDTEGTGYFMFNRDLIDEIFSPKEIDEIKKIRPQRKITGKSIYVSTSTILKSDKLSDRKRIDGSKYPILCDVSIYEDRVQFVTLGSKISSVFIQSKDVAETLKSLFKLAFDNIEPQE